MQRLRLHPALDLKKCLPEPAHTGIYTGIWMSCFIFNLQLNVFCSKRQAKCIFDSLNVLKPQFLGCAKPLVVFKFHSSDGFTYSINGSFVMAGVL